MKILFIAQYFPPEMGALAARASELARHWADSGQNVTVLTGFPNYPDGKVAPEYQDKIRKLVYSESRDGYQVVRTWLAALPNSSSRNRVLNYISFFVSSALTGSFLSRPDIVIASSPPLLVGLTGRWLGIIKRIPFVLEIRDLWPDSITGSGISEKDSLLIRTLRAISGFLYRKCDHLVVVTPAFKHAIIEEWKVRPQKISIVQNGVETDFFAPNGSAKVAGQKLNLQDKFVVSYIGNFGWAQGLETVLEAAIFLKSENNAVYFEIVGAGADRDLLCAKVRDHRLTNVEILPRQPKENIPELIGASDACLVPLRKSDVFKTVIPTKMLEAMSCGRPVILGVDGQARRILEEAHAGVYVEPENPSALAEGIQHLYQDPALRERLGANGRSYILENLSRRKTADNYSQLLELITDNFSLNTSSNERGEK